MAGFVLCWLAAGVLPAADWPMWRYDAGRTAASPEQLPDRLHPLWSWQFSPRKQAWDDPLNQDLMTFDRVFEPIVVGDKLLVGFNDRDQLLALDAKTGERRWTFYTEGPVRLPPAGWQDLVYFASDDGKLYCVRAADGELVWEFRGGPAARHVIGNSRLISAWPVRGGPVIRDNKVYCAASIWPFMGVFIYALDARTGDVVWVNDETSAQYIKQPHSAPAFAGVAPQGAMVATRDMLLVPGGRSVPAVFNRNDGSFRYFELNAGGKGTGGSLVIADDEFYYVHTRQKGTRQFDLATGVKTEFMPNEPVLSEQRIYAAEKEGEQPVVRAYDQQKQRLWQVAADGSGDLIRAGSRLYAAGGGSIAAVELPQGDQPARVAWTLPVDGSVERLLAAGGRLFAVTLDGRILAFGGEPNGAPRVWQETPEPLQASERRQQLAGALLRTGDAQGYALLYGAADAELVVALAHASTFVQLAVIDDSPARIETLRRRCDAAGRLGQVSFHRGTPGEFAAPPYIAHLVLVGAEWSDRLTHDRAAMARVYESVRPYGGTLQILGPAADLAEWAQRVKAMQLEQAEVVTTADSVVVRRVGALPGTSDWTHQYGDVANTVKSNDKRVKLPLGVLWFGGNSHVDILPRHGHGPPEQVVDGRLFIQGINSLSARDVYTGRVLWRREFQNLGTFDIYFDSTYRDTPLDPAYNQVHIPGANGRGTNYVATKEAVYILEGPVCHVLDPVTGETRTDITLPATDGQRPPEWGYIGVYGDVLIGGIGFANYQQRLGIASADSLPGAARKAAFGVKGLDRSASSGLIGFDRHTGKQLWRVDAVHSFWHNGVVAGKGRIYCLDKNPQPIEDYLNRRGTPLPTSYRIVALDAHSGQKLWEVSDGIFGTWLGYSEKFDLLLQAGASASDRLAAETGQGMAVYHADTGAVRWKKEALRYSGPCILHNETIITNANSYAESAGAFSLLTGEPQMVANPITGALEPWKITRSYGCNSIIASENLLTFRSGAAGFYDLETHSGTGNLGGFRSGCTSNLVVANGVLNAPDYTRTCSCSYQNQTSLALVHMPDIEIWSVNIAAKQTDENDRVRCLGINFGAPGDRYDAQGQLWMEYPERASEAAKIKVEFEGAPQYYLDHASTMAESDLPWVVASGVRGVQGVRIPLVPPTTPVDGKPTATTSVEERAFQLRLLFGAPPGLPAERRVFDVWVQGRRVLENVSIDTTSANRGASSVHVIENVRVGSHLELRFESREGDVPLAGLELKAVD